MCGWYLSCDIYLVITLRRCNACKKSVYESVTDEIYLHFIRTIERKYSTCCFKLKNHIYDTASMTVCKIKWYVLQERVVLCIVRLRFQYVTALFCLSITTHLYFLQYTASMYRPPKKLRYLVDSYNIIHVNRQLGQKAHI